MQGLREGQVAFVGQWGLYEFFADSKVFETVEEVTVRQLDSKLLEYILLLIVEVEPHVI